MPGSWPISISGRWRIASRSWGHEMIFPPSFERSASGCLPRRSEGFPLALLEYGRAGLPVVATRVGQCREILDDGRAGLLVPPGDPTTLASAVLRLIRDPALRSSLGTNLRCRVEQEYSEQIVIARLAGIYDNILSELAG